MKSHVHAATCLLLGVALAAAIALSIHERRSADASRKLAVARGLAFASAATLESSPERALLLALEACRRACNRSPDEIYEVRQSLLTALERAARLEKVLPLRGEPRALTVSTDGRHLAVTTDIDRERGSLVVFDMARGGRRSRPLRTNLYDALVFTPDSRRIVAADSYGNVDVVDANSLTSIGSRLVVSATATPSGGDRFADDTASVSLSSDGRLAAVYGTHEVFNVWDVARRAPLRGFPQSRFEGGVFSPDGRTLAAFGADRTTLWDLDRGRAIGSIPFEASTLSFSVDGRTLAVAARAASSSGTSPGTRAAGAYSSSADLSIRSPSTRRARDLPLPPASSSGSGTLTVLGRSPDRRRAAVRSRSAPAVRRSRSRRTQAPFSSTLPVVCRSKLRSASRGRR